MSQSILRTLFISFIAFGLTMGIIFPFYAQFFVEWKPGMKIWFVVGCLVAGTAIGLFNYWLINIILLRRLKRIAEVANKISQKDLTHQCTINSNDVIGEIIGSFNRMAETLRSIINTLSQTSSEVNQTSTSMSTITDTTNQDIQAQHEAMGRMRDRVDQFAHITQQMALHAGSAADAASAADTAADESRGVIYRTVDEINSIASEMDQANSVVSALEGATEEIGSILDVIRGIAEQTNLLALNAAIEAARAGEMGRGFAVVADEVRDLAQRSQGATGKIHDMIERLQAEAHQAADIMGRSRDHAQDGASNAERARDSLQAVLTAIDTIKSMSDQIADASQQQADAAQELHNDITDVTNLCQRSTEGMHQTAGNSDTLTHQASRLTKLISEFRT